MLKNLFTYHLVVTLPIVFFTYFRDYGSIGVNYLAFTAVYPFLFRPLMDYYRLKALGEIEEKDFGKMWKWCGLYRFKYYSLLMFGK